MAIVFQLRDLKGYSWNERNQGRFAQQRPEQGKEAEKKGTPRGTYARGLTTLAPYLEVETCHLFLIVSIPEV